MKTVLITGCSSGFGRDTALHFLARGWQVIATMRTPRPDLLPASDRLRLLALDVRDEAAILRVLEEAGPIDVLVNNAGVGLLSAVEGTPMETVRDVFDTNTLGAIAMCRAVLPQFRARRDGVIINVSSSTTLKALPLLAVYTASKAALNAFTESLALELAPFGVRAHVVLPGRAPETPFSQNAQGRMQGAVPEAYADFAASVFSGMRQGGPVTHAADVVQAVWRAATDADTPLRLPAGADALALAGAQVQAA